MPVLPEFRLECLGRSALQIFGSRVNPVKILAQVSLKEKKPAPVLVFHGIDNTGKNNDGKKVEQYLNNTSNFFNITSMEISSNSYPADSLLRLRELMHNNYRIPFTAFDICYAIYWYKTNPGILLNRETLSISVGKNSFLSKILPGLDDNTCGVNWNKVLSESQKNLPFDGRADLEKLMAMVGMKTEQVLNWMPAILAQDIRKFTEKQARPTIIIIKNYHNLFTTATENQYLHKSDQWLREIILHLPEVTWIITSNTRISWDEYNPAWNTRMQQYLTGTLHQIDIHEFLIQKGIVDESVQNDIMYSCQGIPVNLDMSTDDIIKILNI